jgi:hypothetical protein
LLLPTAHQDNSKVDFYADKRLQNILNHANIVAKPDHIHQSEGDGAYYQRISFLDKPIRLIPRAQSPSSNITNFDSSLDEKRTGSEKDEADIDISGHNEPSHKKKKRKVVRFDLV